MAAILCLFLQREGVLDKVKTLIQSSANHGERSGRISTGIRQLDNLTEGGFLHGRTYLVSGAPGTCKTTFALQFLMAGLAVGENCVYVCVNERPDDIIMAGKSLGWDLDTAVSAGKVQFLDMSPFFSRSAVKNHNKYERRGTDINIRKFLVDLDKYARCVSADRLIIDSINLILPGPLESRAGQAARELVILIEQYLSCTTLLTYDYWKGGGLDDIHPIESYVSGIINLQMVRDGDCFDRALFIKKLRGTAVESAMYRFVIESIDGITCVQAAGRKAPGGNGDSNKSADRQAESPGKPSAFFLKD